MNITNNFSAEAQDALNAFYNSAGFYIEDTDNVVFCGEGQRSPQIARAKLSKLYTDMAAYYLNDIAEIDKPAQKILALPIEERFQVLRFVEVATQKVILEIEDMYGMDRADKYRKSKRWLENTIFADKADEIADIISKLNVDDWSDLCDMIYDALKEKKSAT